MNEVNVMETPKVGLKDVANLLGTFFEECIKGLYSRFKEKPVMTTLMWVVWSLICCMLMGTLNIPSYVIEKASGAYWADRWTLNVALAGTAMLLIPIALELGLIMGNYEGRIKHKEYKDTLEEIVRLTNANGGISADDLKAIQNKYSTKGLSKEAKAYREVTQFIPSSQTKSVAIRGLIEVIVFGCVIALMSKQLDKVILTNSTIYSLSWMACGLALALGWLLIVWDLGRRLPGQGDSSEEA